MENPATNLHIPLASIRMLKSDMTKTVREYEALLLETSDHPQSKKLQTDWLAERKGIIDKRLAESSKCEDYEKFEEGRVRTSRYESARERAEFFSARAQALVPPLCEAVLEKIPAFRHACKQAKPPTERAWQALLRKIELFRSQAEEQAKARPDDPARRTCYQNCVASREEKGLDPLIKQLASSVIEDLTKAETSDEDFVHLVFRGVWQRYQELPTHERPLAHDYDVVKGGDDDPYYKLCMDDVQQILKTEIEPHMNAWVSSRRYKALESLKCPICIRKDHSTRWTMNALLPHLLRHGSECGSDMKELYDISIEVGTVTSFAYSAIRWPRNLPMLAPHQTPTGHWDPDDDSPYHKLLPSKLREHPEPISAYQGRKARLSDEVTSDEFVDLIMHASDAFSGTSIDAEIKTQIAWKYACDSLVHAPVEPIENLKSITFAFIRTGNFSLLSSLSCKICAKYGGNPRQMSRFGKRKFALSQLLGHLITEHRYDFKDGRKDWKTELLTMPSEEDVYHALQGDDMKSARVVFDVLFPVSPVDAEAQAAQAPQPVSTGDEGTT